MKLTFNTLLLAGALASLYGAQAQASSYVYTLNNSNADSVLPDGYPYLSVRIEDSTYGTDLNAIKFTVDVIDTAFTKGTNFGITNFGFNQVIGAPTIAGSNIIAPSGWSGKVAPPPNGFDGFGKFLGDTSGGGNSRLETLVFWISGVNGDNPLSYVAPSTDNATQGNAWFAAHVAGFTTSDTNITSAYFGGGSGAGTPPEGGPITSAVPLPTAFWLFASAIGGLLTNGKRVNRRLHA